MRHPLKIKFSLNDDAESSSKSLGTPLGSVGNAFWRSQAAPRASELQRKKIGPRTALGSGPVHMAFQEPSRSRFWKVFLPVWKLVWVQFRILTVTTVSPKWQRRMEHIEECNLQNMILKVHLVLE